MKVFQIRDHFRHFTALLWVHDGPAWDASLWEYEEFLTIAPKAWASNPGQIVRINGLLSLPLADKIATIDHRSPFSRTAKDMPDPSQTAFAPVGHEGIAQTIVTQIEEMIVTGALREGTRLPSERDLAAAMDVSRPKVREALKQLEADGLIQIRHGEGTFVAPLIGAAMSPALIALYSKHQTAFTDYLEFRREQEAFAAALAAERATDEDRQSLREAMAAMQRAHDEGDRAASLEADVAFHQVVVDACHNSLMIHTMRSIYALMRNHVFYNRDFLRAIDGTGEALLGQHRAIADAILAGDKDAAAEAAAAHIEYVAESFTIDTLRRRRENVAHRRRLLLGLG